MYHGEEKNVPDFLTTIFHPHKKEEEANMIGLGESIYNEGVEAGIERGIERGIEAFILDNLEENI